METCLISKIYLPILDISSERVPSNRDHSTRIPTTQTSRMAQPLTPTHPIVYSWATLVQTNERTHYVRPYYITTVTTVSVYKTAIIVLAVSWTGRIPPSVYEANPFTIKPLNLLIDYCCTVWYACSYLSVSLTNKLSILYTTSLWGLNRFKIIKAWCVKVCWGQ